MRPSAKRLLVLLASLGACAAPPIQQGEESVLEGQLTSALGGSLRGDAYVFLFDAESGISLDSLPRHVTAVPAARLSSGDNRYVVGDVDADRYLVQAFVDVNRNADLSVDVLAQPGAGDLFLDPIEVTLGAGERRSFDLLLTQRRLRDPPAFKPGAETPSTVVIPDQPGLTSIVIESDGLGLLGADGFHVRYVDADRDGVPDDANEDRIPDLEPQFFLRFRPALGQTVPKDAQGRAAEVILPLAFNPAPFFVSLAQDVTREVAVPALTLFVLPRAQAVWTSGATRTVETLGAIPIGSYELVALDPASGFWRVPNGLESRGGSFGSQGTRFRVEHGAGIDAGFLMPPQLP